MSDDENFRRLLDANRTREDALEYAGAIAAFICTLRDDAGITEEVELCALAHHWLDKAFVDAGDDRAANAHKALMIELGQGEGND